MHRLGLVFLTLLVLFGLLLPSTSAQDGGTPQGAAAAVLDFPRDHRLHQDDPRMNAHYIEWLYFTGILRDENARLWGYQVTLWQIRLPVNGRELFVYDVALSDVSHSRHLARRTMPNFADLQPLGTVTQNGHVWRYEAPTLTIAHDEEADVWEIYAEAAPSSDDADATAPDFTLELTLRNDKLTYYTQIPGGLGQIGGCEHNAETLDGYTYYYTHPALTTTATLTWGEQTLSLRGDTWFDHQWGNFNHCQLAWDWFSFRLDDGGYVMIFHTVDANGEPIPDLVGMTYIDPSSGDMRYWYGDHALSAEPLRYWEDPRSGVMYPLAWEVRTPVGTFGVLPLFDDQAMPASRQPYWEGVISVREGGLSGAEIGVGYLEVTRPR